MNDRMTEKISNAGAAAGRRLLHFGCGPEVSPTEWEDYDGSWNLWLQHALPGKAIRPVIRKFNRYEWPSHVRYLDLTRPLPFEDASADAIYASHVLEHLYHADALRLLQECRRVLKVGGVLRLVLPDLEHMIQAYAASRDPNAAFELNRQLLFREVERPDSLWKRIYAALADFHSHKFMYDARLLAHLLVEAGFRDIIRHDCHASAIPEIRHVEHPGRILNGAGFVLESVK